MRTAPVATLALTLALVVPSMAIVSGDAVSPFAYALHAAPAGMGEGAAEPSLGVNPATGAVFFQNFQRTLRVAFDDAQRPPSAAWQDVTPPGAQANVDPILFTDQATGRTYAGGLTGQCSALAFTDDDGASWTAVRNACATPAFDHETIGSGPWARDPLTPPHVYDRAVYYCAQQALAECALSLDGGLTFGPATPVSTSCFGLHGSVHVADDGAAWLPIRNCGPTQGVVVTQTNGRTWATFRLPGGRDKDNFDPDVATTPRGWAYVGYAGGAREPLVALTKDHGVTFLGPWAVGAPLGVRTAAFTEMVAGDDDRAAMVFLGTTAPGNAYAEGFQGEWHLYAATTLDAGATWTTRQLTADPVQRGWICAQGVSCPDLGNRGRNLLDFIDAQVDADGRVLAAFADGCVGACATPAGTAAQSTSAWGTLARQTCGPSLYAAKGNVGTC